MVKPCICDSVCVGHPTLGGSFVILTPFCRILTGNLADGYEVIHKRKSGGTVVGSRSSQILSKTGIQLGARWQFCSTSMSPCL